MGKYWKWLGIAWLVTIVLGMIGMGFGGLLAMVQLGLVLATIGLLVAQFAKSGSSKPATPAIGAFGDGAKYSHQYDGTAIAVSPGNRWVRLSDGTTHKTYSFSDIREWRRAWLTGGHLVGYSGSVMGGVAQAGNNARVNRENKRGSGLFIDVKDIDHPQWRIAFPKEQELLRWYEIMQQTVNESKREEAVPVAKTEREILNDESYAVVKDAMRARYNFAMRCPDPTTQQEMFASLYADIAKGGYNAKEVLGTSGEVT
jgi:hypothetical protein